MRPQFQRVLVCGAGVLGSLYAARLHQAGLDVSLVARGRRLSDLREHGIVLQNRATGEYTVVRARLVESLSPEDDYDLVLVLVRNCQVDAVLPTLAAARNIPSICFMLNTADGYDKWSEAVGAPRVLLGFPGSGGTRHGVVIRYFVMPAWLQPATFGEPDGRVTPRVEGLRETFRCAGLPAALSTDMRSWLTSHVAVVSPLANAVYHSGGNPNACDMPRDTVRLVVEAMREGFAVVRALGLSVTPFRLRVLDVLPTPRVSAARVVLSGVAPVPWRSAEAEKAIIGKALDGSVAATAAMAAVKDASPLADNRYKVPLARGILEETLTALAT